MPAWDPALTSPPGLFISPGAHVPPGLPPLLLPATPPAGGLFGVTAFLTSFSNDDATNMFAGTPGTAFAGQNVSRPVNMRKIYYSQSDGTGNPSFFPAPANYASADSSIQCCIDLGLTAFICYKPAYSPLSAADWGALQKSVAAFSALTSPVTGAPLQVKVILYQEIEHLGLTPAQYFAALSYYGPAVMSVLAAPCLYHDAAGGQSASWASFFPAAPNVPQSLVHGAGIDYYATVYNGNVLLGPYVALCAAGNVPWMGCFEMGVSVGTDVVPCNLVMYGYMNHITSYAYEGAFYCWYEQQNKNLANLVPGYSSGQQALVYTSPGVQTLQTGPNCIPQLQHLADVIYGNAVPQYPHDPSQATPPGLFISPGNQGLLPPVPQTTIPVAPPAPPVAGPNQWNASRLVPPGLFISPGNPGFPPPPPQQTAQATPLNPVTADPNQWNPARLIPPGLFISPGNPGFPPPPPQQPAQPAPIPPGTGQPPVWTAGPAPGLFISPASLPFIPPVPHQNLAPAPRALLQAVAGSSVNDYGMSSVEIETQTGSFLAIFAGWDLHNGVTTAPVPAVYPSDSTGSNIWYHLGTSSSLGYGSRSAIWVCPNAQSVEWVSCSLTAFASSAAYVVAEFQGMPALFDPDLSVSGFLNLGIPSTELLTTPGSGSWPVPAGTTSIEAECWAAGGGGGGSTSQHTDQGATGGGGGEYAAEPALAVAGSCPYTIGAGGNAGNKGSGGTGVNTTFAGTSTTVTAHAGGGGTSNASTVGAGGSGSTNTVHFSGGAGGAGGVQDSYAAGGGGGGSAGTSSAGNAGGAARLGTVGGGGAAVPGGGPGGYGGRPFSTPHPGQPPPSGPGGGGGGGSLSNSSTEPGGTGAGGQIRITYVTSSQTLSLAGTTNGPDVVFGVLAAGNASVSVTSPPAGMTLIGSAQAGSGGSDGVRVFAYWNPLVPGATALAPSWTVSAPAPLSAVLGSFSSSPPVPVQPNPQFPVLRVEMAFGFTPGDPSAAPPAWTDITSRCIGKEGSAFISSAAGREYELTSPEAGELVIGINNVDGAFTPGNSASPWFPGVVVGTPVRVAAYWQGAWYPVAYGYVERWPQEWPDLPQWGLSAMTATDSVAVLNSATMPSALQGDILLDSPYVFLPCGEQYLSYSNGLSVSGTLNSYSEAEAAGLIAANISRVNQQPGQYADGVLGGGSTTIASGSNGGTISNIASWNSPSAGTLDVASTNGFLTSGTLTVATSGGTATITYSGTTSNTFTGCAYVSGPGTVATGAAVSFANAALQAATGQALNLLGDQGTGFGATSISGSITYGASPVTGPGVIYTDPNLPSPLSPAGVSVEAWFTYDVAQSAGQGVTLVQAFSPPSSFWPTSTTGPGAGPVSFSIQVNSATNMLSLLFNGFAVTYPFTPSAAAQQVVVAFASAPAAIASTYLNGVHLGDTSLPAGYTTPWTAVVGGPGTYAFSSDPWVQNFTFADLVVYPYYLPAGRVASHYSTGALGAAGSTVSQGTAQVLSWGYLGIPRGGPVSFSGVSDGIMMGPFYSLGGTSAADGINQLVASDGGMIFAAPTGVLTCLPRWALFGLSPQVTFGDATDGSETPYLAGEAYDYDNTYLYNITAVTRENGPNTSITATTVNTPSQLSYFTRAPRTQTIATTSDLDAYTASQWSNASYAQPQLRVRSLTVDAAATKQFTAVLQTGVADVATVNRRPVGGAPISGQFIVQKVAHQIGPETWKTTYQISPYVLEAAVLTLGVEGQNVLGGAVLG